jgi:hypothetical protein
MENKLKELIERMKTVQNNTEKGIDYEGMPYDEEDGHIDADDILCEYLKVLGHEEIVNEYNKIHKWYA